MLQSRLFYTTLRETPAEAEAASHRLLLRAGFIRQTAAGIYSYLPLGKRVLRKLENIVREEMDRAGAQEMLLPAMQPTELWMESGRYDAYGEELIRFKDRNGREFALGPTHEEVVTSLARQAIDSYRQLPVTAYQIQTKFRDERRPRHGLLRCREFLMKDAYSFDADWEGLDRSYWKMYEAYRRIFARCGIDCRAVDAEAGAIGGEGGTHEFIALAEIGEDVIAVCTHCDYAAHPERLAVSGGDQAAATIEGILCPRCEEGTLALRKGIEIGHVFKLGTVYSGKMNATFRDAEDRERSLIMGCYGIGVSRMLSAIAEQHVGGKGMIWPLEAAPYQVHVLPMSVQDETQLRMAHELFDRLQQLGIEVLMDDREARPGVKFGDADLIGIPLRVVAGKDAALGLVELTDRRSGEVERLTVEEAACRIAAQVGRDDRHADR